MRKLRLIFLVMVSSLAIYHSVAGAQNEGIGRSLGCTFTAIFYPALIVRIDQKQLLFLIATVQKVAPQSSDDFWSQMPGDVSLPIQNLLEKSYHQTRPNSDVRGQTFEFYRQLFAEGIVRLASTQLRSDYVDMVRVVRPATARDSGAYGIRLYLDPHAFQTDNPVQVILICPAP